jgi:hypothetical protein
MNEMKHLLAFGLMALLAFVFISCGGGGENGGDTPGPQPTPEQQQTERLAGTSNKTWRATSITLNGAPAQNYNTDNFRLTFTSNRNNNTVAGDPIWICSGSRAFHQDNINRIIFDNDQNVIANISNLNTQGTQMTLTIDFELGGSNSRVDAINGTYVFTLVSD